MISEQLINIIFGVLIGGGFIISIVVFIAILKARNDFTEGKQASPAGLWVRSAASSVDYLVVLLLLTVWLFLLAVLESWRVVDGRVWYAGFFVLFVIPLLYFTLPYLRGKQTWGKKAIGLKLEMVDGKPLGGWRSFARITFQAILGTLLGIIFALANVLTLAFQPRKRALHDLITGTHVLQTSLPSRLLAPAPLLCSIALVLTVVMLRATVLHTFDIPSESMVPTLQVKDMFIANKLFYMFTPVQRGDIIVFTPPPSAGEASTTTYIKRVIALPGETVNIVGKKGIYINGKPLRETLQVPSDDWPISGKGQPLPPYHMKAGEYLVLGDNRENSQDSRAWFDKTGKPAPGVPFQNILGKASLRYLPFNRIGPVK